MHPILNAIIIGLGSLYLVTIVLSHLVSTQRGASKWLEIFCLTGYFALLRHWTGFPSPMIAFSEPISFVFLFGLQISVMAGILSNQLYAAPTGTLRSWDELAKPLLVAPMLLLPLLGSLEGCGKLTTIQGASFLLLGFQNGFFWRKVFQRIQLENSEKAL
jgi:hypothetical protein